MLFKTVQDGANEGAMARNVRIYPWYAFFTNLLFWQGIWFLYLQGELTPAHAILMYAIYDISATALEVPLGYLSDRFGRRVTLCLAALCLMLAASMQAVGGGFWIFALAQAVLGAGMALESGTKSAMLYESLDRADRSDEIASEELRAWRYQFTALAVSAFLGGILAQVDFVYAYIATAAGALGAVVLAFQFTEPPHSSVHRAGTAGTFGEMIRQPVLVWCMILALVMYVFSHVPFVFGQPFILAALEAQGAAAEAPLVSGAVAACMMLVSVGTSWGAPVLRRAIGFAGIVLFALAMQVGLIVGLAASGSAWIIGLMLLRMVPDSLARPYMMARIQPRLSDRRRATYLSVQSFLGRLLFAGTLLLASVEAGDIASLTHPELREILLWYVAGGVLAFLGLLAALRALGRDPSD